jgi:hypothetical protein
LRRVIPVSRTQFAPPFQCIARAYELSDTITWRPQPSLSIPDRDYGIHFTHMRTVPWSYCVVQPQKRSSWETYDRYPLVRDRVDRWTCTRLKRPPTDCRSTYLHGCGSVATQCYDATPRHVVRKYESKNCQAQMRISPGDLSHHRLRRPEHRVESFIKAHSIEMRIRTIRAARTRRVALVG